MIKILKSRNLFKNQKPVLKGFLTLLVLLFYVVGSAQIKGDVIVVGEYEATLSDAYKIKQNPKITDTIYAKPALKYYINSKLIKTSFEIEPIKPAIIKGEKLLKLYKNYVRLGFGNYTTPYAEFFANKGRSKDYSLGVHLKHLSSSGNIKEYAYPGYSNNEIDLYGRKFYKKSIFSGDVSYKQNVYHFYGFKPDDYYFDIPKDDIKQKYSLIGMQGKINSVHSDSNHLNYMVGLKYYYLADHYKANENNILFNSTIDKGLKLLKLTKKQTLGLKTNVDFYSNNDSVNSSSSTIINLQPFLSTKFNEYNIHFGLNTFIVSDSTSDFKISPEIKASITIIPKVLVAFAGITGDMKRNSLKSLSDNNPFIISTIPMDYSYTKFKFYGGLVSSLSNNVDFTAVISSSAIDNMPFYIVDSNCISDTANKAMHNQFSVVYDDINLVRINAQISYQKDDKINLILKGNVYQYSMSDENEPWHKPAYDLTLSLLYSLRDKIILKGDIFTAGKIYAKVYDVDNKQIIKQIDGYFDLNLGIEYRYTKILSAFINFNNITSSKYQKWYNYPRHGFNFMAGITYSFGSDN